MLVGTVVSSRSGAATSTAGTGRVSPNRKPSPNSRVSARSSVTGRAGGRAGGWVGVRGRGVGGAGAAGRPAGSLRSEPFSGVVSGSTWRRLGQDARTRQHNDGHVGGYPQRARCTRSRDIHRYENALVTMSAVGEGWSHDALARGG